MFFSFFSILWKYKKLHSKTSNKNIVKYKFKLYLFGYVIPVKNQADLISYLWSKLKKKLSQMHFIRKKAQKNKLFII